MLDDNTIDYYRGREAHERRLADGASNPAIAAIHRQLADHYRTRIEQAAMSVRLPA